MPMHEARALCFPYCIQRIKDGRYILLNRNYKPLGIQDEAWVEYENHPTAMPMKITPATAKKLSWKGADDVERIYLYNDGCIPTEGDEHMAAYLNRLSVLMKISVQDR